MFFGQRVSSQCLLGRNGAARAAGTGGDGINAHVHEAVLHACTILIYRNKHTHSRNSGVYRKCTDVRSSWGVIPPTSGFEQLQKGYVQESQFINFQLAYKHTWVRGPCPAGTIDEDVDINYKQ